MGRMSASLNLKSAGRKQFLWPVAGIVLGAIAGTNPFYEPQIPLQICIAAWFVDMALVLILSLHPIGARLGVLVAGLFLAVPCFLHASPLARGLLMCCMAFPLAVVALPLLAPANASFRDRLTYLFTWLGTREVKRRPRSVDLPALLHLVIAALIVVGAMAVEKAVSPSGLGWLVRWLGGGIMILACAEMVTASHDFLTALLGLSAPALMQSPHLSRTVNEFWTKRWNPAASALVFHPYCFAPLARRSVALGLFAAFLFSAIAHVLLPFMAIRRWGISLMCGAFFLVQPFLILAERAMNVRRWRPAAQRVWTLTALAVVSPLFIEPALQICQSGWQAADNAFFPALAVLGFVVIANLFFALGSLVACPKLVRLPGNPFPTREQDTGSAQPQDSVGSAAKPVDADFRRTRDGGR